MKKKNKLTTSARPFGIGALRPISDEAAAEVNGGRVFGLIINPNPAPTPPPPTPAPPPSHHHHHHHHHHKKPIFGLVTNPGSTTS